MGVQSEAFVIEDQEEKVYILRKVFYGLKQALRAWYNNNDIYFMEKDLKKSKNEPTLYVNQQEAIEEEMQLEFCRSSDQIADIFTKALPKDKFQKLREALGVQEQHIKGENVE
ncbi:hypothetical protein CR513_10006, partial [Mucuna pruriens]